MQEKSNSACLHKSLDRAPSVGLSWHTIEVVVRAVPAKRDTVLCCVVSFDDMLQLNFGICSCRDGGCCQTDLPFRRRAGVNEHEIEGQDGKPNRDPSRPSRAAPGGASTAQLCRINRRARRGKQEKWHRERISSFCAKVPIKWDLESSQNKITTRGSI